jgi:hypothetical protein
MSSTKFGSPQELEADRRWLARWNVAEHIDSSRRPNSTRATKEVMAWYLERAKANLSDAPDLGRERHHLGRQRHLGRRRLVA